jgi:A/G-specific adenine glycosylase
MLALPTSDWRADRWGEHEALKVAPAEAAWRFAGEVEHGFTHFTLTLQLLRAEGDAPRFDGGLIWTRRSGLDALPSVFLKAAKAGLNALL